MGRCIGRLSLYISWDRAKEASGGGRGVAESVSAERLAAGRGYVGNRHSAERRGGPLGQEGERADGGRAAAGLGGACAPDPGHAAAILGEAVFGLDLPGARQKALYSLSREKSPEAHEAVLQVARGAANPGSAILRHQPAWREGSAGGVRSLSIGEDKRAKSVILAVLTTNRDSARLMRIAASETSDDLRYQALSTWWTWGPKPR